jgi:two-component system sensor histidine kinase/response regulator
MKCIRLFVSLLIICLFGGSGTLKLMGQSNSAQNLHDTLYDKISYHLERLESDSALAVTDIIYNLYSEKENIYELVRVKVRRAEILRSVVSLDLALDNLLEVQKMVECLEPSDVKSYYYNRLAAVQYERKNADEAITAVRESQRIDSLKNYKGRILSNLNILGSIYRDRKDWEKSLSILSKTYQKAKEDNDTSEMCLAILNLGITQYRKGDYRDAINSAKIYQNYNSTRLEVQNISDNFRILSRSYWHLGVLDSAYNYLDSADRQTLEKMQEIVEKRTDGYRMSNELDKQRLENSILLAEKENSSSQIFFLALTLIFLILLAIFFYRRKQNYKKLHAEKNALYLESENSLLFKNQLIGIVAHDIRSPMSSLTGLIQLYNEGFVNNADLKSMMSKLEASAVSVNFLLENLLNWVLNQKEALNPKIESVNLSALLEKTILELESQTKAKSLSIKISGLKKDVFVSADEAMLNLVIRNICSNGIKFSKEGSELIISYQETENSKLIIIKDFGVGMTKEFKDKLLMEDSRQSQEGTANERGSGLGISISKDFLSAMNASLDIRSQKGKGTEVLIVLPK